MDDLFKQLGLREKETDAFLELIRLGASTISDWAKHASTKRTTMYVFLERLTQMRLVTTFERNGVMYVEAIPIDLLQTIITQKQNELLQTTRLLEQYIPELRKLEKTSTIKPKVKFFEGKLRVEQVYEEVLQEESFKAFFHPARVKKYMPEYFYKLPDTIKKEKRKAQEILVDCKEGVEYQELYSSTRHQIKLLTKDISFSSDTIITSEKIYLIGYGEHEIVATEVWNKELAQTQSTLFDILWTTIR